MLNSLAEIPQEWVYVAFVLLYLPVNNGASLKNEWKMSEWFVSAYQFVYSVFTGRVLRSLTVRKSRLTTFVLWFFFETFTKFRDAFKQFILLIYSTFMFQKKQEFFNMRISKENCCFCQYLLIFLLEKNGF